MTPETAAESGQAPANLLGCAPVPGRPASPPMQYQAPRQSLVHGLALLTLSALLFSAMGVLIRMASHTVNNETVVFFRNLTGALMLLPLVAVHGTGLLKTAVPMQHLWRGVVGLAAMYGFFYAIAHIPLSSAMVFTYSSPVFIPLIAWLVLKETLTWRMGVAALLGFIGVLMVCRPDVEGMGWIAAVGIASSLLASLAFVTVRSLSATEPTIRIVLYFSLISTVVSAIPMTWAWRPLDPHELALVVGAGVLATLSQLAMSRAYSLAPAGKIGPAAYLAIVFAGFWAWLLWNEVPDHLAIAGIVVIFLATLLCLERPRRRRATEPDPLEETPGV
jgi:drug/metabolite transporter (DMT)-like permease